VKAARIADKIGGRGRLQPIEAMLITTPICCLDVLGEGEVAMNPDELADAARKLAHALGIPVYIRDGRIYQHGPGREFLPPTSSRQTVADVSSDEDAPWPEAPGTLPD
jgi:hypothetical protein